MTRAIFTFTILLLSCGQPAKEVKTKVRDIKPLTDGTSNLFADSKASLDNLFLLKKDSSQFSFQDLWTSLLIGNLFSKENKDAVLRYKNNDTVSNVIVLRHSGNSWDTIFSTKIYPVTTSSLEDLVEVSDFNGDNIPDLKVVKDFWDIHPGDNSDLWLYSKSHFTKVKGFDNIVSATYDKSANLIYSYQSTGCADMSMYFGVFKIVGDKVQKIKEMNCDCCVDSNDSCTIEVFGEKPYLVPYKTAYKHVPIFFAEGVKEKFEMVARRQLP